MPLQVENLEELLKEKDNQVDIARTKLSAVQAQTFSSEGTVTSLEEALADRDKQINQLREQRDRAEKDVKEEKVLDNYLINKKVIFLSKVITIYIFSEFHIKGLA